MVDLSIVIVNWNTRELLQECLESVYSSTDEIQLEVFVVDNASSDRSQEMVRDRFPQVQLIVNDENVGFAAANNQAFPLCSALHVLLLNSDTRILGNALDVLVRFMEENPNAGAIGPKVIHPSMRLRVLSCGYQPTLQTIFSQYFFLSSLFPHQPAFKGINLIMGIHDNHVMEVEWLSGACILVRRSVIDSVGPINETWFMYAEDMEWCQRMINGRWKLYHIPQAVIEHRLGASAEQDRNISIMWINSLRSYFIARNKPSRFQVMLFDSFLAVGLSLRAVFYAVKSIFDRPERKLWIDEARKFFHYAATATQFLGGEK